MNINEMSHLELRSLLHNICDTLGIGNDARTRGTILTNIENSTRRSQCLGRVEKFHNSDEDMPLNWGHCPDEYEKSYNRLMDEGVPPVIPYL